jgi:hypothetical protein
MSKFATKLEPHMPAVARRAILDMLPLKRVHGLLGITKATFDRWRSEGEKEDCPDPLMVEFALAVDQARSEAARSDMKMLDGHAEVDWKAFRYKMEIRDPEVFVVQTHTKLDVDAKVETKHEDHKPLSDAALLQIMAIKASGKALGES